MILIVIMINSIYFKSYYYNIYNNIYSMSKLMIKQIYVNPINMFILKYNGNLFGKGSNMNGSLGIGSDKGSDNFIKIKDGVKDVFHRETETYLIDDKNDLYHTGYSDQNLKSNKFLKIYANVKSVVVTEYLTAILFADSTIHVKCIARHASRFAFVGEYVEYNFNKLDLTLLDDDIINIYHANGGLFLITAKNDAWFIGDNYYMAAGHVKKIREPIKLPLQNVKYMYSFYGDYMNFYANVAIMKDNTIRMSSYLDETAININYNQSEFLLPKDHKIKKILLYDRLLFFIDDKKNLYKVASTWNFVNEKSFYNYLDEPTLIGKNVQHIDIYDNKLYILSNDKLYLFSANSISPKKETIVQIDISSILGIPFVETPLDGSTPKPVDVPKPTDVPKPAVVWPSIPPVEKYYDFNFNPSWNYLYNYTYVAPDYPTVNKHIIRTIMFLLKKDKSVTTTNVKFLGKGAFGNGYEIKFSDNTAVFVKAPTGIHDSENMLKREFDVLSKVNHPNIIDEIMYIQFSGTTVKYTLKDSSNEYVLTDAIYDKEISRYAVPTPCQFMITELYDNTIRSLGFDTHWSNPINVLKFLMSISHVLHYIYENKYSHRDIKPDNIMYKIVNRGSPDQFIQYKIIDFGIAKNLNQNMLKTNMNYSHGDGAGTKGYTAPENVDIVTDKLDVYAIGITLLELMTNLFGIVEGSMVPTKLKTKLIEKGYAMTLIRRIKFKMDRMDNYDLNLVSIQIMKLMYDMIRDFYSRNNSFMLMNQIVDILMTMPDEMQKKLREYLIDNFSTNSLYADKINKLDLKFLYDPYYSFYYKFSNYSSSKYCNTQIEIAKKYGHGDGISDMSLKMILCNYVGFNDKVIKEKEKYIDGGRTAISNIINKHLKITYANIKNESTMAREILILEDTPYLFNYYGTFKSVLDTEMGGSTDEMLKMNLICDYVYKTFTNGKYDLYNLNIDAHTNIIKSLKTNEVHIDEFIKIKNGVCRHRTILFKYLCDLEGIKCQIVRGYFDLKSVDPESKVGAHVWNVVIINGVKYPIDIMNPVSYKNINRAGELRNDYVVSSSRMVAYRVGEFTASMNFSDANKIQFPSIGLNTRE